MHEKRLSCAQTTITFRHTSNNAVMRFEVSKYLIRIGMRCLRKIPQIVCMCRCGVISG